VTTSDVTGVRLLLPLGHYVGAFYPRIGSIERYHNVMLGSQVHRLNDQQVTAWLLARGPTDEGDPDELWTRRRAEETAAKTGFEDISPLLDELAAMGLIAEPALETEEAIEFAESYRLVPLMLGLGNTPENPGLHGIGFLDNPVLSVPGTVYNLWEWAHVDDSLWAACYSFADISREAGNTDPELVEPERILNGFLTTLSVLLVANTAYLDRAITPPPQPQDEESEPNGSTAVQEVRP